MKPTLQKTSIETLATVVAPEDLRCGDYVAVLRRICETPAFLWPNADGTAGEMVRCAITPASPQPPWRVEAICLPFLFVKSPKGRTRTLDARLVQLARVDRQYAKYVWRAARPTET